MYGFIAIHDHPSEKQITLRSMNNPRGTSAPTIHIADATGPGDDVLPYSDKVDWTAVDWSRFKTETDITLDYDPTKKVAADPAAATILKNTATMDASTLFTCTQDPGKMRYAVWPMNALSGGSAHLNEDGKTIIPERDGVIRVTALYDGDIRAMVEITIEP